MSVPPSGWGSPSPQQNPGQPQPGPYGGQPYPRPYAGQPQPGPYPGQPYPGRFPGPPGPVGPLPPRLSTGPVPLDQPQYDATIRQATARFWRKYATFSGRASRSEYWWWVLVSGIVSAVLQVIGLVFFLVGFRTRNGLPVFDLQALLPVLIPSLIWLAVTLIGNIGIAVRRLHDTNRSGWWYLLSLPGLASLPFYAVGLPSLIQAPASAEFSDTAFGPLVAAGLLNSIGSVTSIVLLVFLVLGPDPRGARFDARSTSV